MNQEQEEVRQDRRWYDKYPKTSRVLEMLKEYPDYELEQMVGEIIEASSNVKKARSDAELISLGIEKISGIMLAENKQRWYDQRQILYRMMASLSTMKEEDFSNIIDSLFDTLYRVD